VYCRLATALWLSSEYDLAFDATTQALVIAGNENHIVLKMEASHTLGMVHHARGNFAQASRLYTQLLAGIEKKHESFLSVFFRTFMASSLAFMGDFKMALRLFAEGVSIADTVKHPYAQTMIREEMGFCYLVMGDPAAAIKVLEEATEICYEYDVVTMKPALAGRLAHAFSEVGRIEEAIALVDSAFDEETFRRGGRYALIYLLLAQSNVQLRAGFPEDAISSAKEVEKLTGASGEQAFNAYALLALGNAYSACEELNVLFAEAAFLQARSVATQKDMKPLMAQCCLSLGRLLTVSGRREQAEAELIEASRRFRELKLNHLAQQASEVLPD
jgi:tetratricopeptide (TPR) repeat protein